jgi:hypothetical protein
LRIGHEAAALALVGLACSVQAQIDARKQEGAAPLTTLTCAKTQKTTLRSLYRLTFFLIRQQLTSVLYLGDARTPKFWQPPWA